MKLTEIKAKLNEIMLDNYNPRFIKKVGRTQEEIIENLQKDQKSKELLLSMMTKISWVNKVIVVPIEELSEEEKQVYRLDNQNFENEYKYIVVEGNTRISCLHHPVLKKRFDEGEEIPVIVTLKSEGESYKKFLQERKRLQSIANVMVVKEWTEVPKAKQMYTSYKLSQDISPEKSEREILKELSDTLGIKTSIVKMFVYRYAFYKELIENCDGIEEKDFKFLEGLHQNLSIQSIFGLNNKKMEFEWNLSEKEDEELTEMIEMKQQLLYLIPEIIEIAKDEKINSKYLRDILRKHQQCEIEDLYQKFDDICQYSKTKEYSNDGFIKYFSIEDNTEKKEQKIESNIKSAISMLKTFPVNEDFGINYIDEIKKIRELSDRLIKCMDMII
ncbi:hypothetical protein PMZ66_02730 [Clostridium paraputrificum]|uniref:hypothetical protein n=2 Tax=Clostridium paraputrificum TaxID=29363 RepID=UPI00232C0BB5|nr:hypothetical protein [Clostridium paraputrificum]MDB2074514.1 hypothetical protein [Clostridium paraputrificum]MDB2077655.1 hypothetical protein [Clostridium paraputrificum]